MKFKIVFSIFICLLFIFNCLTMKIKKNLKCKGDDINNAAEALKKGGGMTFGSMPASGKNN